MIKLPYILISFLFFSSTFFGQYEERLNLFYKADSLAVRAQYFDAKDIIDELLLKYSDDIAFRLEVLRLKAKNMERFQQLDEALEQINLVINEAKTLGLDSTLFLAYLRKALIFEKELAIDSCLSYLDKAKNTYDSSQNLKHLYATYCVRASSIRRFNNSSDTAAYLAFEGLIYARKYNSSKNLLDANYLTNRCIKDKPLLEKTLIYYESINPSLNSPLDFRVEYFSEVARLYLRFEETNLALQYCDSAIISSKTDRNRISSETYLLKALVFKELNQVDSTLYYAKASYEVQKDQVIKEQSKEMALLTSKYELKKNQQILQSQKEINKKQQAFLIILIPLLIVIIAFSLSLFVSRKRIKVKQEKIATQAKELTNTLAQKEILMSELQHRVKNNLQMVIGLLGLQVEASDQKSVKEIILESQNRIESMAILHDKLFEIDGAQYVNVYSYILDLTESIKTSYKGNFQDVNISINSDFENIKSKLAIPLGLIIVELLSNSYKHAFKPGLQAKASISLVDPDTKGGKRTLTYSDNGSPVPLSKLKNTTGIGMTIIMGLVGQLKGKLDISSGNHLTFKIYF